MKKIIITVGIILASLVGFTQVAPTQVYRIADATTTFDVNISVGKQVYNIAAQELWIATEGVVSTSTLTTAAASFKLVSGTGTANLAEANATETTVEVTSSAGTAATLESASTVRAGLMSKAKFDEVELNNAKETNVSTELTLGTIDATSVAITSDGSADDVVLAAANTDDAGLMTADQFNKLEAVEALAQVNYKLVTETFSETGETATAHTLTHIAQLEGCNVSLNGAVLSPSNYTLAATSITINLPVTQYDVVVITYNY
jgi:hypothetical protein